MLVPSHPMLFASYLTEAREAREAREEREEREAIEAREEREAREAKVQMEKFFIKSEQKL